MKTIYVGCYAEDDYYDEEYEPVYIITWYQKEKPEYTFSILNEKMNDFKTNEYPECDYEYIKMTERLMDILFRSIEQKEFKPIDFTEKTFSRMSSLLFTAENKTIELIVDEVNGFYFVNEIYKDGFGEYPMRIYYYLIEGLNKSGLKENRGVRCE